MKPLASFDNDGKIPTNSRLDVLLEGGVEKGTITQVFGPPSSGKSNIALSLAVNVARNGKKAIYIDTEGGISLDRIKQIAQSDFSEITKNIFVLEPTNFTEQIDSLKTLNLWIARNHEGVDLIILDSAVALYRVEDTPYSMLNKELGKQMGILSKIARKFNIAVFLTNQIYSFNDDGKKSINPVGGDILQYWSKTMIQLEKCNDLHERMATIKRHRNVAEGKTAKFKITSKGII
ncbi:MAG: DNA repair and recombination protein RadB [Methanobrevibacter sp.]|uniref:DNA repair and recombination protein RadB n=1 Tax=Methanobrevibacter sp. TaxID=66852 RepID=UPI0026DFEBE5|nr:DNA repair and recombination protein RadB [Methanobrevibacter sp.]MDO5848428.1 DNA repair and recombination protein RadB [Methanobrevibacter sp.]